MANKWTKEQEDAIYARGQNILVSASAGSGKTAVLVQRIITRVINENMDIDKILVVTFTNAAACELKERLQKAIYNALKNDPKNLHLRKQLNNINRASITTIHAFCLEVIRSNFYKIGIDPNFNICDDIKSKLMKNNALNEVLEEEYRNININNEKFGLYNVLELFNMKDEDFLLCINKILTEIECYISPFEWLKENIEKYNIKDLNQDLCLRDFGMDIYNIVIANLNVVYNKCLDMRKELENYKEEFIKYIEILDEDILNIKRVINCSNNSWDMLYSNLMQISFSNMPRTKVSNEELKNKFTNLRNSVIKEEITNAKLYVYENSKNINLALNNMYKYLIYIYDFALKVSKRYTKMKNEENVIDFTDIEHFALDILLEKNDKEEYMPTIEAIKYTEKFDEIYIDEYQDTSYIQEAILSSISKKDFGNKFMVGDIKQSIYRFRHASPEIFSDKYNIYNKYEKDIVSDIGSKIILAKNFRSRGEVLNSINYIFEQIMDNDMGDCNYSGDEVLTVGNESYLSDENSNYSFEVNILDEKAVEQENNDLLDDTIEYINELKSIEKEAIHIANRIDKMVNIDKMQVMSDGKLRNIDYSDICILLRNQKGKAEIYEKALKEKNIPAYTSVSMNLWDNDEVRLILSFLKVLDNPMQEIEVISLMYSVLGQFTLDDIYKIKSKGFKVNLYNILNTWDYDSEEDENLNIKIKRFINTINEFQKYINVLDISEIISRIYNQTNLYEYVVFLENPDIRRMNLDSLITIASKLENCSNVSEFIIYVEALKEKMIESPDTSKTIGENENVVRIMTIHKSKGLEFPVVIVASCSSRYSGKDMKNIVLLNSKYGIGIDCIDENLKVMYPSVIKEAIKQQMIYEMKSEELRMFYVALTRAKEKIITYSMLKDLDKKLDKVYIMKKQNGKVESAISKNCNSYTDILLLTLKEYYLSKNSSNLFTINHISVNEEDNIKLLLNNSTDKKLLQEKIKMKIDKNDDLDNNKILTEKEKIYENFSFEYPYIKYINEKRRIGVSTLKKKQLQDVGIYLSNTNLQFSKPECLQEKISNIKGARKGTLIHYILENMNYYVVKDEITFKEYMEKLVCSSDISKEEYNSINFSNMVEFIKNSLTNKIREAKYYKKEVEFILSKSKYSLSDLQGVIDLYYEDNDGALVLIDFKTDNLYSEKEFIERYKLQLDIYKEALESLTEKVVKEVYIYSFKLNRYIEIK